MNAAIAGSVDERLVGSTLEVWQVNVVWGIVTMAAPSAIFVLLLVALDWVRRLRARSAPPEFQPPPG